MKSYASPNLLKNKDMSCTMNLVPYSEKQHDKAEKNEA